MYAIVKTGGKQYKVAAGDYLRVERIKGEPGDSVDLGSVLAFAGPEGLKLGAPLVDDAFVKATIVRTALGPKIIVFKKKRRKTYRKKQGHRQWYTLLRIDRVGYMAEDQALESAPEPIAAASETAPEPSPAPTSEVASAPTPEPTPETGSEQ
jgi:large subunit ribosomal protein L21